MKSETQEDLFQSDLRAETIIHIGSQMVVEPMPDVVTKAFDFDFKEIMESVGLNPADYESDALGEISQRLILDNKSGFIVQFATPVPVNFTKDYQAYTSTWNRYSMAWFYGETIQACGEQAIAWQELFIEEEKKRHQQENN